jgi:hypothetical protein
MGPRRQRQYKAQSFAIVPPRSLVITFRSHCVGFDTKTLAAIEEWRRRQETIPTISDAIRQLIELGLKSADKSKK